MFICSTIAYMDRVNISVSGKAIMAQFGLSNIQLGYIFSAFLVGYAAFQIPDGWLADRFGPRRMLTIAMAWWAIFTALTASVPLGLAGGLLMFIAIRFLLGAGEASMYPSTNRAIATWTPIPERGIANGWIFAGVGVGAGLAPSLAVWILTHWGWRWSFWLSGLVGAFVAAVWFWMARDEPRQHPWVSAAEADMITASIGAEPPAASTALAMAGKGNIIALAASYFTYGYAAYIFFAWFFLYLNEARGMNLKASAYYSALPFLAMSVGSILGGLINDAVTKRLGERTGRAGIAMAGMFLAAAFIEMGSRVQSGALASVVLAGGAGALYLSQSSFWSASADIGGRKAGTISGIMNMANQVGGAITASLTPIIAARFGWNASFSVAAVLCVAGGLAWFWVNPKRTLVSEPATPAAP
jgi:ACS family glucarate transporter-like MFS transporter